MLKLATRRRVRTGLTGGYGAVAYLVTRIALPQVGLLLQIGYAICAHAAWGDIPGQYRRRWDDDGESPPSRNPGSLIFHRSSLTGGPTAAGRGSQAPAGQATTHLAVP
jgi:hypothetical protein